jgi:hypothetical protein
MLLNKYIESLYQAELNHLRHTHDGFSLHPASKIRHMHAALSGPMGA